MNKEQYYSNGDWFSCNINNDYYKFVQAELKKWKRENNINKRCMVHHRDDTDETRKYNEEHYELWGFNEDGTFEYGKYVTFVTQSEHNTIHFTGHIYSDEYRKKMSESTRGEKHWNYGKHLKEETRHKIGEANRIKLKGRKVSPEALKHRKRSVDAISYIYNIYKENGGTFKWVKFRHELTLGNITFVKEEYNGNSIYINRNTR